MAGQCPLHPAPVPCEVDCAGRPSASDQCFGAGHHPGAPEPAECRQAVAVRLHVHVEHIGPGLAGGYGNVARPGTAATMTRIDP